MKVLVTGGAGFVGSSLVRCILASMPGAEVSVIDNLRRRGSELNLEFLKKSGVRFHHGDVRLESDLADLPGNYDLMIEASAEPSVLSGQNGSPSYVLETNLVGAMRCLEFVRKRAGGMVFISTSRVYSIPCLREIKLREEETRFEIDPMQKWPGIGPRGITEEFPTHLARSFYGASKLAAEHLIQEYCFTYGVPAVINRCGVIAGPGQFGKVDQGVFTLWVANHYFGKPLKYTGFGGQGKQVRDLLHPRDLFDLISIQVQDLKRFSGAVFNVGGGREISVSMREMTTHCQEVVGRSVALDSVAETPGVDIPLYLTDNARVQKALGWTPQISVRSIVSEIAEWIGENEKTLKFLFDS